MDTAEKPTVEIDEPKKDDPFADVIADMNLGEPTTVEKEPEIKEENDDSFEDFEEPKQETEPVPVVTIDPQTEVDRPSNGLTADLFSIPMGEPVMAKEEEKKPEEAILDIDFTASAP